MSGASLPRLDPCVLEGERVRLEPLEAAHTGALLEHGLDPDLWAFTITRLRTPEEMRGWVEEALRERSAGTSLPFVIRSLADGRVVGSTRYLNFNAANLRTEIGATWIGKPWQGTAVNPESKYLLLRHAFETLGLRRVEFKANAPNERSRRALRRIGAVEEGVFRRWRTDANGRVVDVAWYSVTDLDWPRVSERLRALLHPA